MGYRSFLAKIAASYVSATVYKQHEHAITIQQKLLHKFLRHAAQTRFGREHSLAGIKSYPDYRSVVKIRDYEQFRDYIEQIANGNENVLWPGKPLYFCKSSGTTSGVKYIPVTKEQLNEMIRAARNALLMYVNATGKAGFFDRKMIFLQGSPELEMHGAIPTGRLSGIVYNHVPFYVNANRMPSYEVNCIPDWETKVEAIAKETLRERMGVISGIPPWVVMYFEKLRELSGKEFVKDIFPDFKLFVYGGVNYEPYRQHIEELIGFSVDSVETYPASEGFIAYQDTFHDERSRTMNGITLISNSRFDSPQRDITPQGLLLNVNGGIFYEFVRASEIFDEDPKRISLEEVETGVNYAILLTTNAGLWAYNIGDTVKFVSTNPYRVIVTGRTKHFISAFGEHVIAEEVDMALMNAMRSLHAGVTEFTVAPFINAVGEPPYHEWFIEFSKPPADLNAFAQLIDETLQQHNPYYKDLRAGHILQRLKIRSLPPGAFANYMKLHGKLGGQNKVPRLTNDRGIAEELERFKV